MYIYKFLNDKDEIIYIGKTKTELSKRFSKHEHLNEDCYDEMVRIEYAELNNSDEMTIYEIYYINIFKPKYNTFLNNNSVFRFKLPELVWKTIIKPDEISKDLSDDNLSIKLGMTKKLQDREKILQALNDILKCGEIEKIDVIIWLKENFYQDRDIYNIKKVYQQIKNRIINIAKINKYKIRTTRGRNAKVTLTKIT